MAFGALAALSIGSSALQGLLGSIGSSKGTDTIVNNLGKGIATQSNAYNTVRSDFAPWQTAGGNAMIALADALGISRPTTFPGTAGGGYVDRVGAPIGGPALDGSNSTDVNNMAGGVLAAGAGGAPGMTPNTGFQASPGYQWAFNEGVRAVDAGAATKGLLGSGARLRALTEYGQGVANQEYYNYLGKLFDMARIGASATERVSDAGLTTSGRSASMYSGIGEAKAGNSANQANIWGDVISQATTGAGGGFGGSPLDKLFKMSW